VRIEDNGAGFDLQARPAGIGLRSMRERIHMIGGTLKIDSQLGQGTTLFAWAPLQPPNGADPGLDLPVEMETVQPASPAEKEKET